LKRCGFEVAWQRVETAEEMIDALEHNQWDIIISDYVMPRFGGLEALNMVRERGIELPFIVCSGQIGETAAVEVIQAGATDYLLKDNLSSLKPAILRALSAAEQLQHRHKIERELTLLMHAIETIPIGVTIKDTSGRIIYMNPAEARMHGYSVGELLGKDSRVLAPQSIWSKVTVPVGSYDKSIRESVNMRKDGEEFPVHLISVPVAYADGIPIGEVTVCEDITRRKEDQEKLLFMSTHDALTNLYNRAYFELELQRLDHSRHFPVSVIIIDVNGLKHINDTYGHQSGDLLLQEVGRILAEMFRAEDMVARIGGDEFIVLLPETDSQTVARGVERIRNFLDEGKLRENRPKVCLSLGAATAEKPGTLLESVMQADKNMYQDKLSRDHGARQSGREAASPLTTLSERVVLT
jgi:diguanylate cyclase (GGDEF)-like protein/PAS domain S-box-containing protein